MGPAQSADKGFTAVAGENAFVPPRTRRIALHLEMTRAAFDYNDGLADTLQLNFLDWTQ